jgi:cyclophilin family peptidyl-prolyl cis-trans isomerase
MRQARQRRARRLRAVVAGIIILALVAGLFAVLAGGSDQPESETVAARRLEEARQKQLEEEQKKMEQEAHLSDTPCPPPQGAAERRTHFSGPPPNCIDPARSYRATVETDLGAFAISLDATRAPKTVNNFVVLARYHFYDGVPFHRVIPGFVVQGGDGARGDGTGDPGYRFADELPPEGAYREGSLAMANSGPNTNGSQFFIVTGPNGAALPAKYSLFGSVAEGMDVVKRIEADGSEAGTPRVLHRILRVTIAEV